MMAIKDITPGLKNINVVFIVLEIGSATVTKENREVRNYKVADHSACINVSIWDEPGKGILPGDIIKMTKGYASIWRHCLTLYSGKSGEVYKVGEFCMTFNEQINMSEPNAVTTTTNTGNNGNVTTTAARAMQPLNAVAAKQSSHTTATSNLNATGNTSQTLEPVTVTTSVSKPRGTRNSSIKADRR